MKRSILCILAVTLAIVASASSVTPSQARMVAGAWAERNASFGFAGEPVDNMPSVHKDDNGVKLWYEVRMTDGSCLIVSPVTELGPVIVALENVPENGLDKDHPMLAMLATDMTDRLKKLGLYPENKGTSLMGASVAPAERSPLMEKWAQQGEAKWARYGVGAGARLMATETEKLDEVTTEISVLPGFEKNGPLTHWNQGDRAGGHCYNLYTPENCVCGCVATAMAAMLQYFGAIGCPDGVPGVVPATYNGRDNNGKPFLTIGGEYDWSILADKTKLSDYGTLTTDQRDLLGRVAYDAAVAVGMAWSDGESGAYESNVAKAFTKLYQFKDARDVWHPTSEHYPKLIYNQCRAGAPVGLSIHKAGGSGGHSVLAVGYGIDEDGNPRVRIFTGWGGSGDGWYALPYIDTNGTMDGESIAYDVIQDIVTMIGYDTDETVPVVGQMIPSGADYTITVPAVGDRELTTVGNGYFATRVSASEMAGKKITVCYSNTTENLLYESAAVRIGDNVTTETDANALCDALPDELIFVLLKNTKYALSFKDAIELAKEQNKAILRVCTNGGVSNSVSELAQLLVEHVLELDKANGDGAGFADRFIYQPIDAASSRERDGQLTFGVFLPDEASSDDRWAWYNGRLAYGYVFSTVSEMTVTDSEGIDIPHEDYGTAISNNFNSVTNDGFAATYLDNGTAVSMVTNYVSSADDYADALQAMTSTFHVVLDKGWEEYARVTSVITLTVTASGAEAGTPDPMYGTYVNTYTNGEIVTAYAPGELATNETAGVVMGYSGWTLTNETTKAFQKGTGTSATFTVTSNDVLTLTWQVATNAVWITASSDDEGGTTYRYGTTEPGSGWYPYGETVELIAVPTNDWAFSHWTYNYPKTIGSLVDDVGSYAVAQPVLAFVATRPVAIDANYIEKYDDVKAEELAEGLATNHVLTVMSRSAKDGKVMEDAGLPKSNVTALHDGSLTSVAMGGTVSLTATPSLAELVSASFTNDSEKVYSCVGWRLINTTVTTNLNEAGDAIESVKTNVVTLASGKAAAAAFTLDRDTTLYWMWAEVATPSVDPPPEERADAKLPLVGPDGQSAPLTICPNGDGTITVKADIGNAVKGWWYVIKTSGEVTGTYVKADGDECAKLAEADGTISLSTTFTPTDEKRFYKVTVEGDKP